MFYYQNITKTKESSELLLSVQNAKQESEELQHIIPTFLYLYFSLKFPQEWVLRLSLGLTDGLYASLVVYKDN